MKSIVLLLLAAVMLTGCASIRRSYGVVDIGGCKSKYCDYDPPSYDFAYAVRSDFNGLDMGHQEHRDGDHTKGQYFVLLPDGRRQIVTYRVDGKSGFVADVQYEDAYPDKFDTDYYI